MLIAHLIMVISLSHTRICVQHLKDYNFGQKIFAQTRDPINIILIKLSSLVDSPCQAAMSIKHLDVCH